MVKIAIIGGGYSGLSTAYYLRKLKGAEITLLESGDDVGGLASAFKAEGWAWPVEKYIHHWFTNDKYILEISKELGIDKKLIIKNTKSSVFHNGKIAQMDSPLSLIKFPFLSLLDRMRMGIVMGLIKSNKNFIKREKETAFSFIKRTMGLAPFKVVWEPLFYGKFGKHAPKINAAWFCGRIEARTKNLMYIEGGFEAFAKEMANEIKNKGHKIITKAQVKNITKKESGFEISYGNKKIKADHVVLAVPLKIALEMYDFPREFKNKYSDLRAIGSQYFVLELNKSFLEDGTYWLNINDKNFPFMMVAEHTNFVDKKHYDNKSIVWVGKYLDYDDPLWALSEEDLLKKIIPYMKKINKKFEKSWINRSFFFRQKNTQHITPINYSKMLPKLRTPVPGIFMANIHQIYPYDRATNHSIRIGKEIANLIKKTR